MTGKPKPTSSSAPASQPGAEWVRDMQEHFRENGYYRPADLDRLLGDPRTHVDVAVSTAPPFNIVGKK